VAIDAIGRCFAFLCGFVAKNVDFSKKSYLHRDFYVVK
jgi:hypothetical protein